MDTLKVKLALARNRPQPRLPDYDIWNDTIKLELVGILPNEAELELGCPNLWRKENVSFILSNYTEKTSLFVDLKWRPDQESKLSTLSTSLRLYSNQNVYTYDHIESYKPEYSSIRPNRITQYGSNGANFKLTIESGFRRVRLNFKGHMQVQGSPDQTKFVRLKLISSATAKLFDFKSQLNQESFLQQWRSKKPGLPLDRVIRELAFADRAERLVRLVGEFSIMDSEGQSEGTNTLYLWGFHCKTFPDEIWARKQTKRLMVHLDNGQVFHLCYSSIESSSIETGYTCFTTKPSVAPISKASAIDWDSITESTNKLKGDIHGQGLDFEFEAQRDESEPVLTVNLNDARGWAVIIVDDAIEKESDREAASKSLQSYNDDIKAGSYVPVSLESVKKADADEMLVIASDEEVCFCNDVVGAKAASLAFLNRYSTKCDLFKVPNAIVLSRYAHDLIIENEQELVKKIQDLEEFIGEASGLDTLEHRCQELVQDFQKTDFPDTLKQKLTSKLEQVFPGFENIPFAVRSSSWGEDCEGMSAAGQLKTELNVKGLDQIIQSIKSCFASKYSYQNVEYKRQRGLTPNLPMAVVIQVMVSCDKAGVMFTSDPVTGNDASMLITANYGLGESVVSAQADPDSIRVSVNLKDHEQLVISDKHIGKKLVVISDQSQPESEELDKTKCCLNDEEILRLAKCGQFIRKMFNGPRDIEWGFKGGELHLFQSRPITGLDLYAESELIHEGDRPSRAEDEWSTRVNFNEVFPYAVTPFTLSFYVYSWAFFGSRVFAKYDTTFESFAFPMIEGQEKSTLMKSSEIGMFGHEVGDQPGIMKACRNLPIPPNIFDGWNFQWQSAGFRMNPIKKICREYDTLKMVRSSIEDNKFIPPGESNLMLALYRQMIQVFKYLCADFEHHYLAIMLSSQANLSLHGFLSQYIQDPRQLYAALNKFITAAPNVISAEIPRRIEKIAETIKAKGSKEMKLFAHMTEGEALEYLEKSDVNLAKQFQEFIDKFGHRCYNEFEVAGRPWSQDLNKIVEMLQKNCMRESKPPERNKETNIDKIIESLNIKPSFKERFIMKNFLVPKCHTMIASREFTKDLLIAYVDVLRKASRKLAREMQRNLRIPDVDLFYFLLFDEVEPLIISPQPSIVCQAIRRRQLFKRHFDRAWKFEEIIEGYRLIPLHLRQQQELDPSLIDAPKLFGSPGSSGRVEANICIINGYNELNKIQPGDILVTHSTDIAFSTIFPIISGIVTEVGGLISHGAVVAREYGLPSLLGVVDATRILEDGERVVLDADNGHVIRLMKQDAEVKS